MMPNYSRRSVLGKRMYRAPKRAITPYQPASKYFKTSAANRAFFRAPYAQQRIMIPAAFQPTGSEIKAIDIPNASHVFRSTAVTTNVILLNGVQTGAGFFNRVGSRVEMKNLHIRGNIEPIATSTPSCMRMIIVYDRQPTGALPVISELIQARDQDGNPTTQGYAEINLDNRDRFQILRDIQLFVSSLTFVGAQESFIGVQDGTVCYAINEFIKLKGLGTHYNSTASPVTIANIATGALYCFFLNGANGTDSSWQFTGQFRLRYNDK